MKQDTLSLRLEITTTKHLEDKIKEDCLEIKEISHDMSIKEREQVYKFFIRRVEGLYFNNNIEDDELIVKLKE